MATFKIGQRVKFIHCGNPELIYLLGTETTIEGLPGSDPFYLDHYQTAARNSRGQIVCAVGEDLAPLTDPRAEEFIASLERLGREPLVALPVKVPS